MPDILNQTYIHQKYAEYSPADGHSDKADWWSTHESAISLGLPRIHPTLP